jgi:signal transduction histidine kinase
VELAVDLPATVHVGGDVDRLRQLFFNLLDNAIKYTPENGRVQIGSDFAPECTTITVRDSGIGIEDGDLPRIWDRLYRADKSRSQRGLGLGLSLVKAFVEAHGGTAVVSSKPGEGSLFTVTFPRQGRKA